MHLWPRNGITVNKTHLTWNTSRWHSGSPGILRCLHNWKILIHPSWPCVRTKTFNIKSWIFLSCLWWRGLERRHANMTPSTYRGQKATYDSQFFPLTRWVPGIKGQPSAFTTGLSCQPQGIQYKNNFFNYTGVNTEKQFTKTWRW